MFKKSNVHIVAEGFLILSLFAMIMGVISKLISRIFLKSDGVFNIVHHKI